MFLFKFILLIVSCTAALGEDGIGHDNPKPVPVLTLCPPFWTQYGKSCFRYFGEAKLWEAAEETCKQHATLKGVGHLVSVHNDDENIFVFNLADSSRTIVPQECAPHASSSNIVCDKGADIDTKVQIKGEKHVHGLPLGEHHQGDKGDKGPHPDGANDNKGPESNDVPAHEAHSEEEVKGPQPVKGDSHDETNDVNDDAAGSHAGNIHHSIDIVDTLTWLGLSDISASGHHSWTDGRGSVFAHWQNGTTINTDHASRRHKRDAHKTEQKPAHVNDASPGDECVFMLSSVHEPIRSWGVTSCHLSKSPFICKMPLL